MRKRLLISAIALAAVAAAGQTVPHGSLGFGVQIDTNLFLLNPSEIVTTPDGTLAGYATVQDLHAAANAATNHSAANLNIAVGHADSLTNALWLAIVGKQGALTAGENITISNDVISATGGGGMADETVTQASDNAVKSSGIWNWGFSKFLPLASYSAPGYDYSVEGGISFGGPLYLTSGAMLGLSGLKSASNPNTEIDHQLNVKENGVSLGRVAGVYDLERHADSVTNVVWETCYSNGWVFLRAAGPKEED